MAVVVSIETLSHHRYLRWHINRPDRLNSLGTTLAAELTEALRAARENLSPDLRAIVISAESVEKNGQKYWISGGDLKELAGLKTAEEAHHYAGTLHRFCRDLETLPVPVITFVAGAAIGGGAELALAGDLRVGTSSASFEWRQLKMGLATGYGAAARLIELVGKAAAQRYLFLCETLSAETALSAGLLHRIVDDRAGLNALLSSLFELEPRALAAQKKLLHLATSTSGGDRTSADEVFAKLWRNPTHERRLQEFSERKSTP